MDALATKSLNYSDKSSITNHKQKLIEYNTNTLYLSKTHLYNRDYINVSNKLMEVKNIDCSSNKIMQVKNIDCSSNKISDKSVENRL